MADCPSAAFGKRILRLLLGGVDVSGERFDPSPAAHVPEESRRGCGAA